MKIIKRDSGNKQEINTETYLKKKKIKKENMGKIDIIICLKKRKKRQKEYQKNYHEVRKSHYNNCDIIIKQFFNHNIIVIKQFFNYDIIISKIVF